MADPDPPGPHSGGLCREIETTLLSTTCTTSPQWCRQWQGGRVTFLLLDPTKEGRSRGGPAPREGIELLEFYTIQCSTLTFWAVSQQGRQPLFSCLYLKSYQPSGPIVMLFSQKLSVPMRDYQPLANINFEHCHIFPR